VGYDVAHLLDQIGRELGLSQDWPVVVVGVGNLGHALANYGGFASRGFRLVALFDADPRRIGEVVAGLTIRSVGDLAGALAETGALIAVVATPADAAQGVCDTLVASGVRSILNFAPAVLSVPAGVEVRKVDLASELQILTFHEQRKSAGPAAAAASVARSTVGVGG
jgi:redox-sensing transcriptional repressor